MRENLGSFVLAALLLCAQPEAAGAHAVLLESTPAADSVVAEQPAGVVLTFNEPVRPVFVRVLDARGRDIADGATAHARDTRVELPLPARLADGAYIVSWRVVSTDSHPIGGSFRFAVGAAPVWEQVPRDDGLALRAAIWEWVWILARAAFLFALLGAVGGVWFLHLNDSPAARRATRTWLDAAVLTGIVLIPLQGAVMRVATPADLFTATIWRTGFDTPLGTSAALAVLALSASAIAVKIARHPFGLMLLSLLALLAPASLALTGHVASAEPRMVTALAVALHGATAAFWLGALWRLAGAARHLSDAELAALLQRFSRIAMPAVAALALAGLVLALIQVESAEALVATVYGRLLLLKVAIVTAVLLIAWDNKRRLTPAIAAGDGAARARLQRNIRLEIAGLAAIILMTAILSRTTPPRAIVAHAHPPHAEHTQHHTEVVTATDRLGRRAEIRLSPHLGGGHAIAVQFHGADGSHLVPKEAELFAALPARGIEPIRRPMLLVDHGARYEGNDLSLPGRWTLRIDALITDFDKAMFEAEVELR